MLAIYITEWAEMLAILILTTLVTAKSFKENAPIYFKIVLFGVWCEILTFIYVQILQFCAPDTNWLFSLFFLGICGAFVFFYLANSVFLKSFGKEKKFMKESLIALAAPIAVIAFMLTALFGGVQTDAFVIAVMVVIVLFLPRSAYICLKMLLIKSDRLPNLRIIKPVNAFMLAFSLLISFGMISLLKNDELMNELLSIFIFAFLIVIVALCGLERKKWKT